MEAAVAAGATLHIGTVTGIDTAPHKDKVQAGGPEPSVCVCGGGTLTSCHQRGGGSGGILQG